MAQQETIWNRLAAGKLPSMEVNTAVAIDQASAAKTAAIFFIALVAIILAYFAIRKQFTA